MADLNAMTKTERLKAAVRGEAVDRLPYSFWSHMPGVDLDPEAITAKTYEFYKTYDFDFIKTMNNGMYAVEDFGCTVDYSEIASGGVAHLTSTPIGQAEDMRKLEPCDITKGSYARELHYLELILDRVRGENVPVLFTAFSPITILDKLTTGAMGSIRPYMEEGCEEELKAALEVITETTSALVRKAIDMGADGIFFASQLSSFDFCTEEQYRRYGVPYDTRVLESAAGGWMNTIHCHGNNIMFDLLSEYPVDVLNWHIFETGPAPAEARAKTSKCIMGGMARMDITKRSKDAIRHQIRECFKQLGGRSHILTPGCVIRYPLDDDMLAFIGQAKAEAEADFKAGKML